MEYCPFCDEALDKISRKLKRLENQNKKLRSQIEELSEDDELHTEYFVGSKSRSTFHRPDCVWVKNLLCSNRLVEFYSHEEAVDAGYKPCKSCRA